MKRYNNLCEKVNLKLVNEIYNKQIRVNTKNKLKLKKFEDYYSMNVSEVMQVFEKGNYIPLKYTIFLIKDPKYRIIMSQNVKDKLINHVVGNILIKIIEPSLIDTNVATRKEKGTHYGIKYLKKYLNDMKKGNIYALKFDISKYFYSMTIR